MKRNFLITIILMATFVPVFGGTSVFAEQSFQFAPSRGGTTQTQQQPARSAVTDSFSNELSIISEWEDKILAAVPSSAKDRLNDFDSTRVSLAKKYTDLRDISEAQSIISLKINKTKAQSETGTSPKVGYYVYVVLAFFFGYRFVFYGTILLTIFFILRFILRRFNVIV